MVCGKTVHTLKSARETARIRNASAKAPDRWNVTACWDGCGPNTFHLTRQRATGKQRRYFNMYTASPKKRNKRQRSRKNQRVRMALAVGVWEDDGGALHPRDLED